MWALAFRKRLIKFKEMEELAMKGFNTGDGYMGLETVRKSL